MQIASVFYSSRKASAGCIRIACRAGNQMPMSTGGATVTPTSGIVTERFPLAQSAALVGLLFLGHQLGAFLSAFLGGMTVAATGSYQGIWGIDIVFCLLASYLSAKILPHQQGK